MHQSFLSAVKDMILYSAFLLSFTKVLRVTACFKPIRHLNERRKKVSKLIRQLFQHFSTVYVS